MFVRYKYRLYPTKCQELLLKQFCGAQRWIWNHFLEKEKQTYQETKKFNFYNTNAISLPKLKKEFEWLKEIPSQSLQQTLRDLNNALLVSFKRPDRGFPKFKKRKEFEGSFRIVLSPNHWNFNHKMIKIPKLGEVKWKYHRKLPSSFSTATVIQDGDKWFISIVISLKEQVPVFIEQHNQIVGLDLNSKMLVVSSDGELYENHKFLKKSSKLLKRRQRQFAKSIKGSNRRKVKQLQVRNIYKKITNQRKDSLHKISNQITNDYDLICMENLNVKGIQKFNGKLVQDTGFSIFTNMIEYKAKLKGKHIQKIERFAPSTKICNFCGHIQTMKLSDRIYDCSNCGKVSDRDLNAALNIRDWGLFDFINEKNTLGTREIYGRGDTSAGEIDVKSISRYVSLNRQKFLASSQEAR